MGFPTYRSRSCCRDIFSERSSSADFVGYRPLLAALLKDVPEIIQSICSRYTILDVNCKMTFELAVGCVRIKMIASRYHPGLIGASYDNLVETGGQPCWNCHIFGQRHLGEGRGSRLRRLLQASSARPPEPDDAESLGQLQSRGLEFLIWRTNSKPLTVPPQDLFTSNERNFRSNQRMCLVLRANCIAEAII